jgi:hypothetical protein
MNMQGGQYRRLFERTADDICTKGYNETFRPYFDDFQAVSTPKVTWKTCPYPKGDYDLKNYMIEDHGNLLPPYLPGNERWQIQLRYFKGDKPYGGANVYATLRSEKSLLEG